MGKWAYKNKCTLTTLDQELGLSLAKITVCRVGILVSRIQNKLHIQVSVLSCLRVSNSEGAIWAENNEYLTALWFYHSCQQFCPFGPPKLWTKNTPKETFFLISSYSSSHERNHSNSMLWKNKGAITIKMINSLF